MKKQYTNEEKVLQVLIKKFKDPDTKTNNILVYKTHFSSLDMTEVEIIKSLYVLQEDGMLKIVRPSNQNNLDIAWSIDLNSEGIHYFETKQEKRNFKVISIIAFLIPTVISIIALFV